MPATIAPSLPRVVILGTGGTIASAATASTSTTDYDLAQGIDAVLAAVPEMQVFARVSSEQVVNLLCEDIDNAALLQLACRINDLMASDEVDGSVVTRGTDTMEETVYFLKLVVKTRATATDVFSAPDCGFIGSVAGADADFQAQPLRSHTKGTDFDIAHLVSLPQVDIPYGHQHAGPYLLDAAIENGAKGIVDAGPGNGTLCEAAKRGAAHARARSVAFERASRVGGGASRGTDSTRNSIRWLRTRSISTMRANCWRWRGRSQRIGGTCKATSIVIDGPA